MSLATSGPGMLLGCESSPGSGVYTTIAEVLDIAGPGITVKVLDVTNQSSPDRFAEKLASVKEGGTCDFEVNTIPGDATQAALLINIGTKLNWQVTMGTTGKFLRFAGLIVKWLPKFPYEKVMTTSVSIQVTGKPAVF